MVCAFLSCLFGSERLCLPHGAISRFLSCLFGSERASFACFFTSSFLSCLFGSERMNSLENAFLGVSKLPIRQ